MPRNLVRNYHAHEGGHGAVSMPNSWLLEPAYSVLPVIRKPVGNRHTNPIGAILRAAVLIFLPPFAWTFFYGLEQWPLPDNIGHTYLVGFVVLCVVVNCAVWVRRLIGLRRGEEIHQAEAGYSFAAWLLPLPAWLTESVLVPAMFVAAGWYTYQTFSRDLGAWLVLCGFSLAVMASWEIRRRFAAVAATSDGMIQGQSASWRVDQHEQRAKGRGAAGGGHVPEFAEMANGPAEPPDVVTTQPGSDSLSTSRMTWFRRRTPGGVTHVTPRETPKQARRDTEDRDFADLG